MKVVFSVQTVQQCRRVSRPSVSLLIGPVWGRGWSVIWDWVASCFYDEARHLLAAVGRLWIWIHYKWFSRPGLIPIGDFGGLIHKKRGWVRNLQHIFLGGLFVSRIFQIHAKPCSINFFGCTNACNKLKCFILSATPFLYGATVTKNKYHKFDDKKNGKR